MKNHALLEIFQTGFLFSGLSTLNGTFQFCIFLYTLLKWKFKLMIQANQIPKQLSSKCLGWWGLENFTLCSFVWSPEVSACHYTLFQFSKVNGEASKTLSGISLVTGTGYATFLCLSYCFAFGFSCRFTNNLELYSFLYPELWQFGSRTWKIRIYYMFFHHIQLRQREPLRFL